MTEPEIYERLTPIFREVFDDDELIVRPELTADDVPEWDSMTHVRLILSIEREFRARFPAADVSNLNNVGELVSLICRRT